ncbi:MAG: hypothetical protein AB8F95_01480 [Bacteroidia bacterium]
MNLSGTILAKAQSKFGISIPLLTLGVIGAIIWSCGSPEVPLSKVDHIPSFAGSFLESDLPPLPSVSSDILLTSISLKLETELYQAKPASAVHFVLSHPFNHTKATCVNRTAEINL